jgi:hypothetical protein
MDSHDADALNSLTTKFEALMPAVAAPQLPHQIAVDPVGSGPAGIGGVVGISHTPPGDILGRRLRAFARVRVQTTDVTRLDAAVTGVTAAVLAGDRAQQRADGLLSADLDEIGPEISLAANGGPARFGRDVRFKLLYEHLVPPEETGDMISEVHAKVANESLVISEPPPAPLGLSVFGALAAAPPAFDVVDDEKATRATPSAWSFDAAAARFVQTSGIWGGVRTQSANKPGTYLLLDRGMFGDLRFEALLGSIGEGAIGLVFRWTGPDDFHFFLLGGDPGYRLLGRKARGSFTSVAVAPGGRTPGAAHQVVLTAQGADLSATVDGGPPLAARDMVQTGPGRVGFMSHNDAHGFFSVGELTEL